MTHYEAYCKDIFKSDRIYNQKDYERVWKFSKHTDTEKITRFIHLFVDYTIRGIWRRHPNQFSTIMEIVKEECSRIDANKVLESSLYDLSLLLYQVISYEEAGKKNYEVTYNLTQKLLNTELRGVKTEDMRLPYEGFYIEVPAVEDFPVLINDETDEDCTIQGIFITEEKILNGRIWYISPFSEIQKGQPVFHEHIEVFLPENQSLEHVLEKIPYAQAGKRLFSWILNLVLYVTWEEPGENWETNKEAEQLWQKIVKMPKNSRKRQNLENKHARISRPRIQIGKNIIDRVTYSSTATRSKNRKPNVENPIKIKIRVAGHWRRVAHGPKKSLRRMQWIKPFWRNKDGITPRQQPTHKAVHDGT